MQTAPVVAAATSPAASARVASRGKDGEATRTRLHERCVGRVHVLNALLLLLVQAVAHALDQRRRLHAVDRVDPFKHGKIFGVYDRQGNLWSDGLDVLNVKLCLWACLILVAADDLLDGNVLVATLAKRSKILRLVILAGERSDGHGVPFHGAGRLSPQLVALRDHGWGHQTLTFGRVARVGPVTLARARAQACCRWLRPQARELQELANHRDVLGDISGEGVAGAGAHNPRMPALPVAEEVQGGPQGVLHCFSRHLHGDDVATGRRHRLVRPSRQEVAADPLHALLRHCQEPADLLEAQVLTITCVPGVRDLQEHALELIALCVVDPHDHGHGDVMLTRWR
mmetsp:Transcript_32236/g.87366  ORF Transcript_32236/g.87366 Transcript_32236/m.87366 type:complete len:342 (+) Transcript_32236:393-1418(+)